MRLMAITSHLAQPKHKVLPRGVFLYFLRAVEFRLYLAIADTTDPVAFENLGQSRVSSQVSLLADWGLHGIVVQ